VFAALGLDGPFTDLSVLYYAHALDLESLAAC